MVFNTISANAPDLLSLPSSAAHLDVLLSWVLASGSEAQAEDEIS